MQKPRLRHRRDHWKGFKVSSTRSIRQNTLCAQGLGSADGRQNPHVGLWLALALLRQHPYLLSSRPMRHAASLQRAGAESLRPYLRTSLPGAPSAPKRWGVLLGICCAGCLAETRHIGIRFRRFVVRFKPLPHRESAPSYYFEPHLSDLGKALFISRT